MELQTKKNKNPFRVACSIILVAIIISTGLISFQHYLHPKLIGKWISMETGKIVQFTEQGTVKVNNTEEGTYILNTSSSMDYVINGYLFKMNYELAGRTLLWGIDGEEVERFERK